MPALMSQVIKTFLERIRLHSMGPVILQYDPVSRELRAWFW